MNCSASVCGREKSRKQGSGAVRKTQECRIWHIPSGKPANRSKLPFRHGSARQKDFANRNCGAEYFTHDLQCIRGQRYLHGRSSDRNLPREDFSQLPAGQTFCRIRRADDRTHRPDGYSAHRLFPSLPVPYPSDIRNTPQSEGWYILRFTSLRKIIAKSDKTLFINTFFILLYYLIIHFVKVYTRSRPNNV